MGALWWMNNDKFMSMPDELKTVIVDGFYQLQQATFASPKRKSIQAYADFVAGGGDLYVPTPAEKAAFKRQQPQFMTGSKQMLKVVKKCLMLSQLPSVLQRPMWMVDVVKI